MRLDKNIQSSLQAFVEGLLTGINPPSEKKMPFNNYTHWSNAFVDRGLLMFEKEQFKQVINSFALQIRHRNGQCEL